MHFITGIQKSGMNVLADILSQNPEISCYKNTPLYNVTTSIIEQTYAQGGYRHQCSEETRKNIITGIFDVYNDTSVSIDVNYKWSFNSNLAESYGKVICCVRNIADILNSYEYDIYSKPFDNVSSGNVYSRSQDLMQGIVGESYTGVKQLISTNSDNVMVVDYDILCNNPKLVIDTIYQFLGLPKYDHTIDIKRSNKKWILPPDIKDQYSNLEVWK